MRIGWFIETLKGVIMSDIPTEVKDVAKAKKRRIADFLKKEDIIADRDTGLILIHLNDGGITKISFNKDILK